MNIRKLQSIPPWDWPANASSMVIKTLMDRSASKADRLLAADLAGEYTILSETIADALLMIISSKEESAELRSRAAIALGPGLEDSFLGDYEDPDDPPALSEPFVKKIQQVLRRIYFDEEAPKAVRRSALEASVRSSEDWHHQAIQTTYDSNDAEWQLTSVFCMCYVKGFENQILESLKSSDPNIRYHAITAAGNWEIDAAWPNIAQLVISETADKSLRLAAIKAAASIRPHETDILEPLVDASDEDISETAMEALAEAGYDTGSNFDDFDVDDYEEEGDGEEDDYEEEDTENEEDDD